MLAHLSGLQREPVGDVWESLRGPVDRRPAGRSRRGGGGAPARAAAPLQQPRLRPARRGRGAAARRAVGRGAAGARPRPARDEAYVDRAPAAVRRWVLRRALRRPRGRGGGVPGTRVRAGGRALVDDGRPRPVGVVHRRAACRGAVVGHARGDVPPAGHVRPRRLDARLGPRSHAAPPRRAGRWSGTTARCPGSWPALAVRRPEKVGAVVLANTSSGADPGGLAVDLALSVVDDDPDLPTPWRPGGEVPDSRSRTCSACGGRRATSSCSPPMTGTWRPEAAAAPSRSPPAVFAAEGPDRFRVVSGRETGRAAARRTPPRRHGRQALLGDLPRHPRPPRLRRLTRGRPRTSNGMAFWP